MKVAVLIPCYNEELTVKKVVEDFKKELPDADIYVYNNNSTDKTVELAKAAGAIVRNEYKQGKGNVVKRMFEDVEADIYVLVDGDDTYPASSVHDLIKPVAEGSVDMAVGDRLSNGTYKKENKRTASGTERILMLQVNGECFGYLTSAKLNGYGSGLIADVCLEVEAE